MLNNVRDAYRLIRLHRPYEAVIFEKRAFSVLRTHCSLLLYRLLQNSTVLVLFSAHKLIYDAERGQIILCCIYCVILDREGRITRTGSVLVGLLRWRVLPSMAAIRARTIDVLAASLLISMLLAC